MMFCPSGRFVPPDALSYRYYVSSRYVSGRFFSGRFVPLGVLSPDVVSGHQRMYYCVHYFAFIASAFMRMLYPCPGTDTYKKRGT